jgi:hypothetical protein
MDAQALGVCAVITPVEDTLMSSGLLEDQVTSGHAFAGYGIIYS